MFRFETVSAQTVLSLPCLAGHIQVLDRAEDELNNNKTKPKKKKKQRKEEGLILAHSIGGFGYMAREPGWDAHLLEMRRKEEGPGCPVFSTGPHGKDWKAEG